MSLRLSLALLTTLSFSPRLFAQNPPDVGSTTVTVQAKGVGQDQEIVQAGEVSIKVSVDFEYNGATQTLNLTATVDVPANTMTKADVAEALADSIEDDIAAYAKYINTTYKRGTYTTTRGNTLVVEGTRPGEGSNTGTIKEPEGADKPLTAKPRAQYYTQ